jgi:hypothetical protein
LESWNVEPHVPPVFEKKTKKTKKMHKENPKFGIFFIEDERFAPTHTQHTRLLSLISMAKRTDKMPLS